jgi:lipoprotein-anchoring transpeptidase ErfK/SrfK
VLFRSLVLALISLGLVVTACQAAPASPATPTATASTVPSDTPIPSPTNTVLPTFTPEPAWYQPLDPALSVLKYHYAQVNNTRARVYASLVDAAAGTGNYGYLPNYPAYVSYTTRKTDAGQTYFLTNYGWMKGADLQDLTPSKFTGILLTREVSFRFGWVLADVQSVNAAGVSIQAYTRYQVVHEVPAATQKPGFIAIGADEWLPEDKVALITPQLQVDAGANVCNFIAVNLAMQTMTVYDKCKLVFATLVSSGKNSWTFQGNDFHILYKVEYSSITPPDWSTSKFYIEGLPYFMTYSGDFGFHAAYWHDNFGIAASHGCINLSPADARWLYHWAGLGERVIISAEK